MRHDERFAMSSVVSRWFGSLLWPWSVDRFALLVMFFLFASNCNPVWSQAVNASADPQWNYRYEVFQLLLQQSGLRVEKNIARAIANPRTSVIVTMGNLDRSRVVEWTDLRNFVDRGGKLMIAADGHFYSPGFGTINPGPVTTKTQELKFQGFDDCIRIQSFSNIHPITRELTEVITNRSGWVDSQSKRLTWEDLILLPDSRVNSRPQPGSRITALPSDNKPILSIGYSQRSDDGFVIMVADPSIFSNGMLWYANNGDLVAAIANELAAENRTNLVMIVDSQIQSQVMLPSLPSLPNQPEPAPELPLPKETPSPQLNSLLQVANAALKEVADPARINDQLRDRPRNVSLEDYSRWIWTGAAAIAIAILLWQLLNRSPWFAPFATNRKMTTARNLLNSSRPIDLQNKMASETLAREFSRQWTGRSTESDWRVCLDQLKHSNEDRLTPQERTTIESMLAVAIFGGKSTMDDADLERQCSEMQILLQRFRSVAMIVA